MKHPLLFLSSLLVCILPFTAAAEQPADFLHRFSAESGGAAPQAARGEKFFKATHGGEWSCASCHTDNPAAIGRHANTGKRIEPLAPAANPQRFTRTDKVDKWFRRNCNDVLKRECSSQEKADVLAYLMTQR